MNKERSNESREPRLHKLNELEDYEIADHDPDVRGWNVVDGRGREIGEVDELIVDLDAMKVRYIDMKLDGNLAADRETDEPHVIVPIGLARLDEEDDTVRVDTENAELVIVCPVYDGGQVTPEYESQVRERLVPKMAVPPQSRADYYNSEAYDENRFYGSRRGMAGSSTFDARPVIRRRGSD